MPNGLVPPHAGAGVSAPRVSGSAAASYFGEGAVISRNWATAHFLTLWSWCQGCVTQLAVVFQ